MRPALKTHTAGAAFLTLVAAGLSACGTYEPPQPGTHRLIGRVDAEKEMTCGYEQPTASKFIAMRCRNTADMAQTGEQTREAVDQMRNNLPNIR